VSSFSCKEAHKLKFVPPPTIEHKVLTDVLKEINGQEMRQTQITEETQIENTYYSFDTSTSTHYHPPFELNPLLNKIAIHLPPPLPMCNSSPYAQPVLEQNNNSHH
jgi:hypothetical protein